MSYIPFHRDLHLNSSNRKVESIAEQHEISWWKTEKQISTFFRARIEMTSKVAEQLVDVVHQARIISDALPITSDLQTEPTGKHERAIRFYIQSCQIDRVWRCEIHECMSL